MGYECRGIDGEMRVVIRERFIEDCARREGLSRDPSETRDVLFISPEVSMGKIDVFIGWDASWYSP